MARLGATTGPARSFFWVVPLSRASYTSAVRFEDGRGATDSFPCGRRATADSRDSPVPADFFSHLGGSTPPSPPDDGATPPTPVRSSSSSSSQSRRSSGCGDLPAWRAAPAACWPTPQSRRRTRLHPSRADRPARSAPSARPGPAGSRTTAALLSHQVKETIQTWQRTGTRDWPPAPDSAGCRAPSRIASWRST